MRRLLLTTVVSVGVLSLAPAAALARHRHPRHHKRVHHATVRRVTFGSIAPTATTTPTTTPPTSAGTVDSFVDPVLKIKLNDAAGTIVSGMVTPDTKLECQSTTASTMGTDESGPGSSGGGDETSGGGGDTGDDDGVDQQSCTTAALTAGAVVQGAELSIASAGAVWDKVELVTSGTGSSPTGTGTGTSETGTDSGGAGSD
jgi:hypothetical protein